MRALLSMTIVVATMVPMPAHAQCGPAEDDLPCNRPYVAWSWLPQLSAFAAYDESGAAHSLFGAELRIRYHSPRKRPDRALTFGLGVETYQRETLEPYANVGLDLLTQLCDLCASD